MATTVTFDEALKRYMPYELLVAEMKRRNFFVSLAGVPLLGFLQQREVKAAEPADREPGIFPPQCDGQEFTVVGDRVIPPMYTLSKHQLQGLNRMLIRFESEHGQP